MIAEECNMKKVMIPRTIHYCWFGHNPKPELAEKCIKSWKKKCPDYKIIEWNEENFNLSTCPLYVRQAYEAKKWAFVTDYVRLKVVYEHGGIYLDTDVELKKNLDFLLKNRAYFGFEEGQYINTGLGFGAEKGTPVLEELMQDYESIPFVWPDGTYDSTTCPQRNTEVFLRHGLVLNDTQQILDDGTLILPTECLCPISYSSGNKKITRNTISIHWFNASWQSEEVRRKHNENVARKKKKNRRDYLIHTPNRIARFLLGSQRYENLKTCLKKGDGDCR